MEDSITAHDRWPKLLCEYHDYIEHGDFQMASEIALQAHDHANRSFGPEHPSTCLAMTYVAFSYVCLEKFQEALGYYSRVIDTMQDLGKGEHHLTALALCGKGIAYAAAASLDEAMALYKQAVEIIPDKNVEFLPDLLDSLATLGSYLVKANNSEASLEVVQKGLALCNTDSYEGREKVRLMYELAVNHYSAGNVGQTQQILEGAIQAINSLEKVPFIVLGEIQLLLGHIYKEDGDYATAETCLREALQCYRNEYGAGHLAVVQPLCGLAQLYTYLGNFKEAKWCYEEAAKIIEKQRGADNVDYADLLSLLGNLYLDDLASYSLARECFEKARAIYLRELGTTSAFYRDVLWPYGIALREEKNYKEAAPLMQEAIDLYLASDDSSPEVLIDYLEKLGMVYHLVPQFEEEEATYQQALELRQQLFGQSIQLADGYRQLAACHHRQKRMHEARKYFSEALEIHKAVEGEGNLLQSVYEQEYEMRKKQYNDLKELIAQQEGHAEDTKVGHVDTPGFVLSVKKTGDPDSEASAHLYCNAVFFLNIELYENAAAFLSQLLAVHRFRGKGTGHIFEKLEVAYRNLGMQEEAEWAKLQAQQLSGEKEISWDYNAM